MNEPEPRITDWQRILNGDAPFAFLFEVFLRFLVVYTVLAVVMRLLGKRMSGQLSNVELAVMLLLGAIVGAPLTVPERGLVPGVFLLAMLVALHRGLSILGARSSKAERFSQGRSTLLVKDGRLLRPALESSGISNEQLFSGLRAKQIRQLGELKRLYYEAHGDYSIIRAKLPQPGLTVQPASDQALQRTLPRNSDLLACARCGHVVTAAEKSRRCPHCSAKDWSEAVAVEPGAPATGQNPS
jgi:uncharacterized membrane protein YcaP (DUF421 family)